MPWVRFDDTFSVHRKVEGLSDAAFRLHISAVFWCARNLTDGFVPEEDLELVTARVRTPGPFAAELVRRGLWHPVETVTRNGDSDVTRNAHVEDYKIDCDSTDCPAPEGPGWVIHDYLEFQPSKDKVREDQSKNADRQRRYRERQAAKKQVSTGTNEARNGVTNASHDASHDRDRNGVTNDEQTPPRPDPTRDSPNGESDADRLRFDNAVRIPQPFPLTEEMKQWVRDNTPSIDAWKEHQKFGDHFLAAADKTGRKKDWLATWRNWMRRAQEYAEENAKRRGEDLTRHVAVSDERCEQHPRQIAGFCQLCDSEKRGAA